MLKPSEIGVTGCKGRIGSRAVARGFVPLDFDVRDEQTVFRGIQSAGVKAVWHCAAKTNVDWCELPENEQEVIDVNLHGVFNVTAACQALEIPIVFMSSDHIFSGEKGSLPYTEADADSDELVDPVNYYGMTKLAGEGLVLTTDVGHVIRTSYVFDDPRKTIYARLLATLPEDVPVTVPTMIVRSFMYIEDFLDAVVAYFSMDKLPALVNISGTKSVSWYEFMQDYCKAVGIDKSRVKGRKKYLESEFAPRPKFGGLDVNFAASLGFPLSDYKRGLKRWKEFQQWQNSL